MSLPLSPAASAILNASAVASTPKRRGGIATPGREEKSQSCDDDDDADNKHHHYPTNNNHDFYSSNATTYANANDHTYRHDHDENVYEISKYQVFTTTTTTRVGGAVDKAASSLSVSSPSPVRLTPSSMADEPPSSPFVAHVYDDDHQHYNSERMSPEKMSPEKIPGSVPRPRSMLTMAPPPAMRHTVVDHEAEKENGPRGGLGQQHEPDRNIEFHDAAEEQQRMSPIKMLQSRISPTSPTAGATAAFPSPQKTADTPMRTPRRISAEKRFPVRPSSVLRPVPSATSSSVADAEPSPDKQRPAVVGATEFELQKRLRENEGLTKAIEILEEQENQENHYARSPSAAEANFDDTLTSLDGNHNDQATSVDDTFMSTFSSFSAVPEKTMYEKFGHSPSKLSSMLAATPSLRHVSNTPSTARRNNRSPSPTPRGNKPGRDREDTTNLILDFTEQMSSFSGYSNGGHSNPSPTRRGRESPLKSMTMPDLSWGGAPPATPSSNRHNISNLLDFDIPPAPTPRSMPTITPRELESLKSKFMSEISSLKATLSGKEAEVGALKTSVMDAEKRVGESMEQYRETRDLKEQVEIEKEEWEKRGREMEAVLRNVKEEIVLGERERDGLEGRLEESERRREAAEMMAQEAESKMAGIRAGKVTPSAPDSGHAKSTSGECECGGTKAVEVAVEKVSRELHTLYKDKHETKVTALKKSYERRWEKRVKELEVQVEDLTRECEELRIGRDATMTKVEARPPAELAEEVAKQAARDAHTKELEAEREGLAEMVKSVQRDAAELRQMLEEERLEKGKLVAAVEEMMPLVAAFDDMLAAKTEEEATVKTRVPSLPGTPTRSHSAHAAHGHSHSYSSQLPSPSHQNVSSLRGSGLQQPRASGLRAPTTKTTTTGANTGESRVGRGGFGAPAAGVSSSSSTSSLDRSNSRSGSSAGARPGSGLGHRPGSGLGYASRGGMMSSIERMGSGTGNNGVRGRGDNIY